MEEKNKKSLDDAIRNLPQYKPPADLWSAINEGMEESESATVLQKAISELPSYSPPDKVWENIVQALPNKTKKTAIVRRMQWLQVAAACLLGIIGTSLLFNFYEPSNPRNQASDITVTIAYDEEKVNLIQQQEEAITEEVEDTAFEIISQACSQKHFACSLAEFKELRFELKDLDYAIRELSENLTAFETDATHLMQLARYQRNRADVIKKLVALI